MFIQLTKPTIQVEQNSREVCYTGGKDGWNFEEMKRNEMNYLLLLVRFCYALWLTWVCVKTRGNLSQDAESDGRKSWLRVVQVSFFYSKILPKSTYLSLSLSLCLSFHIYIFRPPNLAFDCVGIGQASSQINSEKEVSWPRLMAEKLEGELEETKK